VARSDVPTCGLQEPLGAVVQRVRAAGWDACVVVNSERVVLGLLRAKELEADPELRIEQKLAHQCSDREVTGLQGPDVRPARQHRSGAWSPAVRASDRHRGA